MGTQGSNYISLFFHMNKVLFAPDFHNKKMLMVKIGELEKWKENAVYEENLEIYIYQVDNEIKKNNGREENI